MGVWEEGWGGEGKGGEVRGVLNPKDLSKDAWQLKYCISIPVIGVKVGPPT